MIVDTSALVAVLNSEPEALPFLQKMSTEPVKISAVTLFEFSMVIDRYKRREASLGADRLLAMIEAEVVSVDVEAARGARLAYATYGKGNHPARLNFGDCFAYALAKETGEPLLFKGDDFARTDVRSAV
ncbi:type II toxin-antitoxin system VapC family toxin [Brevundimonas halotolerans]|uniref:Ribonuclease VapC n=1 Tax=Brevundimonas halotolerans TaxID=69670 RepID=A0A7W9A0T4_9CAUL|nr:type II toxin-antitoxin system VapC family toxin [Brevundimonas halotolerans]MBB5659324.1 ribonuclease VapC [Brevundimonas halotolerans]